MCQLEEACISCYCEFLQLQLCFKAGQTMLLSFLVKKKIKLGIEASNILESTIVSSVWGSACALMLLVDLTCVCVHLGIICVSEQRV